MIATAPGKLILTGEYAVLDGAPALVMAVDRRAVARLVHREGAAATAAAAGSPFLDAIAAVLAARRGAGDPAARAAREIAVDSSAFYDGGEKLGLGSSAAVTVAAAARALAEAGPLDRAEVLAVAQAAHADAQAPRGARGSGADVAAAVHGGLIVYETGGGAPRVERRGWPAGLALVPFFTGHSADTPRLVAQVAAARAARPAEVGAALAAIDEASRAACAALAGPPERSAAAVIAAFVRAGDAVDALARTTGADLVPDCVMDARAAVERLGGAVKTTGAGGGDLAVALIPAAGGEAAAGTDVTAALIQAGCRPLHLSLDGTGVDTRPGAG